MHVCHCKSSSVSNILWVHAYCVWPSCHEQSYRASCLRVAIGGYAGSYEARSSDQLKRKPFKQFWNCGSIRRCNIGTLLHCHIGVMQCCPIACNTWLKIFVTRNSNACNTLQPMSLCNTPKSVLQAPCSCHHTRTFSMRSLILWISHKITDTKPSYLSMCCSHSSR